MNETFVFGVKAAQKKLAGIAVGIKNASFKTIIQTAIRVSNDAKMLCPVGSSGHLRASIGVPSAGGIFELYPEKSLALVGTNVEYAAYVEFGTFKMAAQPFMRPAAKGGIEYAHALARRNVINAIKMSNAGVGRVSDIFGAASLAEPELFEGINPEFGEGFKGVPLFEGPASPFGGE